MRKRNIRFWLGNCLEVLGTAAGGALVWFLVISAGTVEYTGNIGKALLQELEVYPYYLLITGTLILSIIGINYFQVYFSILLSMSVTRKRIVRGILISTAGSVLGILSAAGLIWKLVPGDISASGWSLMPLFTGALFLAAAFFLVLGMVLYRWGKYGVIILTIVYMLIGAAAGMAFAFSGSGFVKDKVINTILSLTKNGFGPAAFAGMAVYLAAGLFIVKAASKMEVRV